MSTALKLLQRTPDQPADLLQGNPELGKVNTAAGYTPGDVPVVGTSGGASGDALSFVSPGVGIEVVLEDGVKCYHHPAVAGVATLLQLQMVTQSRAVALHRWVKRAGSPSATIEWLRSVDYGGGGGGPGINMDTLGRVEAGQAPTTVAGTTPLGSWFREELVMFNIAGSQAPGAYLSYACYDVAGDLVFPILEQWNSTQIPRGYRHVTFGKSNTAPTFPEFWQTDLRATINRTVHITGAPLTIEATGALTLPQLEAAGAVDVAATGVTGAGALQLPQLTAAGAGTVTAAGTGALPLPQLAMAGQALVRTTGAGTLQLGQLTAAGQALVRDLAAGAVQLPQLTVVATALVAVRGQGVLELPMLVVAGSTLPGEYPAVVVLAIGRPREVLARGRGRSLPATGRGGGYAAGGGGLRAIGRPKL